MTRRRREPLSSSETGSEPGDAVVERLRDCFDDLAAGRIRALERIYAACAQEIHGLALWRTGSAADAADVVQEVFVRLAAAPTRLRGVRDPRAYLRRMVHRASIDVHRKRARRREAPLEECRFVEAPEAAPDRRLDAERTSGLLATLPAAQREAIFLRHFAGCSFAEVGRATGVPTFTAASRYRLGMQRLRRLAGVEP